MGAFVNYFRTHDVAFALFVIAVVVGASIVWDRSHKVTRRTPSTTPTVEFIIDVCSPFNDAEEHHLLEFDSTNGTVELLKMRAPAAREETVSSSDNRVETHGTFMMSESTRTVRVTVGDQTREYLAFMQGNQCILVHGSLRAANLAESWYGEADYSSGDD